MRPGGLEPPTRGLEGRRSIQLSYGRPRSDGTVPAMAGRAWPWRGSRTMTWPFPRRDPGRERSIVLLRRLLVLVTVWHLADSVIGVATGTLAASSAVIAFGVCSFALLLGSLVVLWRFSPAQVDIEDVEQKAERLVGLSFYFVAALAAAWAVWAFALEHDPAAKPLDIVVAIATLLAMPPVGLTVMTLGEALESGATRAEGYQTVLYGLLAGALLLGLAANALFDAWWADPAATLIIAAVALRAGRRLRHPAPVPDVSEAV
jgi:divalent metal cation (Fe/Co/Zn/Cd) transporter